MLLDDKSPQADDLSLKGRGSEWVLPNPTHPTGGRARVTRLAFPHHMGPLLLHAFFGEKFCNEFFKKFFFFFFTPQESKLETKQFQSAERARLPHSSQESPPPRLHVKCLVIKKRRLYMDTESFEQRPRLQKRLLCMDVLGELDFCVVTLMAPSRYVIKLLFFVSS